MSSCLLNIETAFVYYALNGFYGADTVSTMKLGSHIRNHLVLFMQVCFTFQSSHTMLPTRRPVNTTTRCSRHAFCTDYAHGFLLPLPVQVLREWRHCLPEVRVMAWLGQGLTLGLFLPLAVSSGHHEFCLWTLCHYCLNQSASNLQVPHKYLRNEHV